MAINIPLKQLDEIDECFPLSPPHSHCESNGSANSMSPVECPFLREIKSTTPIKSPNSARILSSKGLLQDDGAEIDENSIDDEINVKESNATIKANHVNKANSEAVLHLMDSKQMDYNSILHLKKESMLSQDTVCKQPDNLIIRNRLNKKEIEFAVEFMQEKKQIIKLKFDKMFSLINKGNSLYHIFRFLSSEELKLFYDMSKKARLMVNIMIRNVYFNSIIPQLKKNNPYFEILRSKIHYSTVKKKLFKIDLVVTFRIIPQKQNDVTSVIKEYKNITIAFIYKHTKTSQSKAKLVDYYSFDLINTNSRNSIFPPIYMTREFKTLNMDVLQKTYIQPILPFKIFDQGIINIQIYSPENLFVDYKEIKIRIKTSNITSSKLSEDNPRVCEYEDICSHWKAITFLEPRDIIMNQLRDIFEPYFRIMTVMHEDIGYLVFKVVLKAIKSGVVKDKDELGINIRVKEKDDVIVNEIKKNDILFEKRNEFELRIDDVIIFYLTNNK